MKDIQLKRIENKLDFLIDRQFETNATEGTSVCVQYVCGRELYDEWCKKQ